MKAIDFASLLPGLSAMTDEQWAEHDARIEAEKLAARRPMLRVDMREDLRLGGFPARAVDVALEEGSTSASDVLGAHDFGDRCVVVLAGKVGCGKTVAATRWFAGKQGCLFLRATEFAAGSRYDADLRRRIAAASGILLDDLGQEFADVKGSFLTDLQELIDICYGDYKPLIITTNLAGKDFAARYGERIADRLRECGRYLIADGHSLRKKGSNA